MSNKLTVALLFGGQSVEHQISINSAKNIFEYIDKDNFEVILIGISQSGSWYLKTSVDDSFSKGSELDFSLDANRPGFVKKDGQFSHVDILFPILHGTDGEDGSIQGLLTTMGIPFVGTGVLGSAISMNKLYSKRLMAAAGIPIGKFVSYTHTEKESISFDEISLSLGLPFMAKASNLGSSVGIFKVSDKHDFAKAVAEIFTFDDTLLCEEYVDGRELECSILGNLEPRASLPGEIVVSDTYEFYTYEAKYLDPEAAKLEVPANIEHNVAEKIRQFSIQAYQTLHCEDFARVDLFLKSDGTILINEINTIPGFTNSSMFPTMWKERGISFTELITELITLALARAEKNKNLVKVYKPA